MSALADRLRTEIVRNETISVEHFVAAALYDPSEGFYCGPGQAGRSGDFLTAVEVGPLFGAVVSRAVDQWWEAAGRPERFVVAEHGAGPGTLGRAVTLAEGDCLRAGALQWVMIEPSDPQRSRHPTGPHLVSQVDDANLSHVDVVFANELLDNLPFGIVAYREGSWVERRVGLDGDRFVLRDGEKVSPPPGLGSETPTLGAELPILRGASAWLGERRERFPESRMVLLDYAAPTVALLAREAGWLRAFRNHQLGRDWLSAPGTQDITVDIPIEQVAVFEPTQTLTQAEFLHRYGIDELVEQGRQIWQERAAIGDLVALRGRSRANEAAALLDPDGMGAFRVFVWAPSDQTVS
jgi:SAM-dependent MidA family methyltransferase